MKIYLALIFSAFSSLNQSQNCSCKSKPNLNEIISCEKTIFKNGAKIYCQFDCKSSWVTFENRNHKKTKIFSLEKELLELTGRLGFSDWTEYKNSFLVEYRPVSGCCDPSLYILFDKNNGKKISDLGSEIFHSKLNVYPYFVTIADKSNFLLFLNLDTNKVFKINLPKGQIEKTLKLTNTAYAETLFSNGKIENGIFKIEYLYKQSQKSKWSIKKLVVDLR